MCKNDNRNFGRSSSKKLYLLWTFGLPLGDFAEGFLFSGFFTKFGLNVLPHTFLIFGLLSLHLHKNRAGFSPAGLLVRKSIKTF